MIGLITVHTRRAVGRTRVGDAHWVNGHAQREGVESLDVLQARLFRVRRQVRIGQEIFPSGARRRQL